MLWLYGDDQQLTEVGTMNLFVHWVNEAGGVFICRYTVMCVCVSQSVSACVCMHVCVRVHMCICARVCMCVCVGACVRACMCVMNLFHFLRARNSHSTTEWPYPAWSDTRLHHSAC